MQANDKLAGIMTAGLLSLLTAGANAAGVKTISKSGSEADQIPEHAVGQYVVKCVGAAKGGENDCGALDGSHDCAGLSPAGEDYTLNEWVYMTLDQCAAHENGHFMAKTSDGSIALTKVEFQVKKVVE